VTPPPAPPPAATTARGGPATPAAAEPPTKPSPRPVQPGSPTTAAAAADVSIGNLEQRARTLTDQAIAAGDANRNREAARLLRECVSVRRELVRRLPNDSLQRARLAWALSFLAQQEHAIGDLAPAAAGVAEAVQLAEPLVVLGASFELDFAFSLFVQGIVQRANGRPAEACQTLERARHHLEATRSYLAPRMATRFKTLDMRIPAALAACR
jgi:hypothetical protein